MRYAPRDRRRGPSRPPVPLQAGKSKNSFAYAGGEITVRKLPVPDLASAPPLPPHLVAVLQPPEQLPPTPYRRQDIQTAMDTPSLTSPACPAPVTALAETPRKDHPPEQPAIPDSQPNPSPASAIPPRKAPRCSRPRQAAQIQVAQGSKVMRKPRQNGDISLSHHRAHCTICNHPEREIINQAFLHWQRPTAIAHHFQLGDRRIVNRHAEAFGLFQLRASRSRRSLEFIMEQAETVTATVDSVIRAVRAHACLGEDGCWTEPTKRTIITHEYLQRHAAFPDEPTAARTFPTQNGTNFSAPLLRKSGPKSSPINKTVKISRYVFAASRVVKNSTRRGGPVLLCIRQDSARPFPDTASFRGSSPCRMHSDFGR
jgi:hypothetical protein